MTYVIVFVFGVMVGATYKRWRPLIKAFLKNLVLEIISEGEDPAGESKKAAKSAKKDSKDAKKDAKS
jgi:hypothetical protein